MNLQKSLTKGLPFIKMHGLGNDFVVIDARQHPVELSQDALRAIAERRRGVGCDQVIVVGPPEAPGAQVFMSIYNPDGGEVAACGNATRCIGQLMMEETGQPSAMIQTRAGILRAELTEAGEISVDMGPALLAWDEIPLAQEADTLRLPITEGPLSEPVAVSMGNPHMVFFVEDVDAVDLETLGPTLEHHALFPERTNVEVVQVVDETTLRMRVWERGAGITQACGTGACASLVAAARRNLMGQSATVQLDGGSLQITWRKDGGVTMAGPASLSFYGVIDGSLIT